MVSRKKRDGTRTTRALVAVHKDVALNDIDRVRSSKLKRVRVVRVFHSTNDSVDARDISAVSDAFFTTELTHQRSMQRKNMIRCEEIHSFPAS
jgi:hypothetical protein